MAGVEWKGCKCKGATQAKGALLHSDKKERLKHGHGNPDIDLSKTVGNFSFYDMSYAQKCRKYDDAVASAKVKRKKTGENANTTMIGLCVYLPKALQDEDRYDPQIVHDWFMDAGKILEQRYGKYFVDIDVHVDEVHPYIHKDTKGWTWARVHGHASVIPAVCEDGEYYLSGKKFSSRKEINELNAALHEMSMQKYHVPFMDGGGKQPNMTIGKMKAESARLLMEKEKEVEARERAVETREKDLAYLIKRGREAGAEDVAQKAHEVTAKKRPLPRGYEDYE